MAGDVLAPTDPAAQQQLFFLLPGVFFYRARYATLRARWNAPDEMARWQSGYAAACKAVYAGSIPTLASIFIATPGWRNW